MKALRAFEISVNICIWREVTCQGDMKFQRLCENIKCCLANIWIYRLGSDTFKRYRTYRPLLLRFGAQMCLNELKLWLEIELDFYNC